MDTPKVSIIIPIYNAEKHIRKCVDSVLEQTFKDFELLLMNDGSTDNSLDILLEFEKNYDNIRVVDKKNEGVSLTRNRGIRQSQGRYVMFIDNDDFIDKDYVETYYKEIEKSQSDIVIGGYRRVSQTDTLFEEKLKQTEWAKYIVIAPWAKIYNRDFLLRNEIDFLDYGIGEDVYFNLVAYSLTDKIKTIDYIGYNWYFNDNSISNTDHVGFKNDINILYLFDKIINKLGSLNEVQKYYFKRFYIYYLLFSGRTARQESFLEQYQKIMDYVKEHNIKTRLNFFSPELSGESIKARVSILCFDILGSLHLVPFFAKIYCKGQIKE